MVQLSALKILIWLLKVLQLSKTKSQVFNYGGGAAGFSAIQAIKENDPDAQVQSFSL